MLYEGPHEPYEGDETEREYYADNRGQLIPFHLIENIVSDADGEFVTAANWRDTGLALNEVELSQLDYPEVEENDLGIAPDAVSFGRVLL